MNKAFSPSGTPKPVRRGLRRPLPFASAGYTLFPLAKRSKIPRDRGWRTRDYSGFDADAWLRDGGNVGIRLAADDLVLDVDPRHDGNRSLNELSFDLDTELDRAPTNLTGRGDGGRHIFFKKPAGVAIIGKHPKLPGLDFKTEGGFVVTPGSVHPESGGLYEIDVLQWTGIEKVAHAPAALVEFLRRPEAPERTGEGGELSCEELELALSALRPEDYGQSGKYHDQWLTIAAAAHDATDGLGLEEWLAWCERDEQYGPEARELNTRRWNSFTAGKSGGVTYKTLLKAVSDAGRSDILASLRTSAAEDFDDYEDEEAPPASIRTVAGLTYQRADEVEQQNINWLWPNRIAIGKLSGIAGPPDQGKSQLTAAIAATVTRGGNWPDAGQAPTGAVVMLSAEDDPSDTIAPRLEAAGADMTKVYLPSMLVARQKGKSMFNLAEDINQLTALKTRHPEINVVIIDPISAYMGSSKSVDTFRNSDVRGVLAPLGEWATKHGVAVVFVTHFSKSGTGSAINRVMDSLAFTALARSFWVVVPEVDEESRSETGRKLLLKGKQNIAQPMGGLAYRIEGVTLANGVQTSRIVWDDEVDLTGDDVLLRERTGSGGAPKLDAAKAFLVRLLKDGEANVRDIEAAAKREGHTWATVRRARDSLPVSVYQHKDGWSWELEGTETE